MTRETFKKMTENALVFLDGATGTNLMQAGLPKGVCSEQWALEYPSVIRTLQSAYLEAGSAILTPPPLANALSLESFGLQHEVRRINTELVALSKDIAGDNALVAGDITTVGRPMAPLGDLEYHQKAFQCLPRAGAGAL